MSVLIRCSTVVYNILLYSYLTQSVCYCGRPFFFLSGRRIRHAACGSCGICRPLLTVALSALRASPLAASHMCEDMCVLCVVLMLITAVCSSAPALPLPPGGGGVGGLTQAALCFVLALCSVPTPRRSPRGRGGRGWVSQVTRLTRHRVSRGTGAPATGPGRRLKPGSGPPPRALLTVTRDQGLHGIHGEKTAH